MIFISNKYTTTYYRIVERARTRKLSRPYEQHHVIPESFFINRKRSGPKGWLEGNPEDKSNKVILTPREHFICHWLLLKMVSGPGYCKMIEGLRLMKFGHNHRYATPITARVYEKLKGELSRIMSVRLSGDKHPLYGLKGSNHPAFGKKYPGRKASDLAKIERSIRVTGEGNNMYGRKGIDHPAFGKKYPGKGAGDKNPNFGKKGADSPNFGKKLGPHPKLQCPHCSRLIGGPGNSAQHIISKHPSIALV